MGIKTNLRDLTPARGRFASKIKLLSGGHANAQYFPEGMITIYPWDTAVDELMIRRSGDPTKMLHAALPKLCELNGCPITSFIASELMLVVLSARAKRLNSAETISADSTCPKCKQVEHVKIKVPDQLTKVGEKAVDWPGFDTITLPECQDVVAVRMLTIQDELSVQNRTADVKASTVGDEAAKVLAGITAINSGPIGPGDAKDLVAWWKAMPVADSAYLMTAFADTQPHVSLKINVVCEGCQQPYEFPLDLDTNFFR